jgi:hypothetical protein
VEKEDSHWLSSGWQVTNALCPWNVRQQAPPSLTSQSSPPQSTSTFVGSPDVVLVVVAASGPLVVVVAASGPLVVVVAASGPLVVLVAPPLLVVVVDGPELVVEVVSPEEVGDDVAPPSEVPPPSLPPPNTPSQSGAQPMDANATTTEANRPTLRMRTSLARSIRHGVRFANTMASRLFSGGRSQWLEAARSFAEALFSTERGAPPRERLDRLMADLEDFVAEAGPRSELVLRLGLGLAMWGAPPLVGRRPPMTRLSVVDRARALDALEHSPVGLPLLAAKAILSILYYEDPEVLREAGIIGADETKPGCARVGQP